MINLLNISWCDGVYIVILKPRFGAGNINPKTVNRQWRRSVFVIMILPEKSGPVKRRCKTDVGLDI